MTTLEVTPEEVSEGLVRGSFQLIDVRGLDEYETARIEGSTLLSRELVDEIESAWEKHTPIVFYCHHGTRSLSAVHYFVARGFTNVRSMSGGIDAWSLRIDSRVPRY